QKVMQRLGQHCRITVTDERAALRALLKFKYPGLLERSQCLAHGRPAHLELRRQITLCRQFIAGLENALLQAITNLLADLFEAATCLDLFEVRRFRHFCVLHSWQQDGWRRYTRTSSPGPR